jgi:hypothetical protein
MVEPFSRVGHDFKHGVMSLLSKTNKNAAMKIGTWILTDLSLCDQLAIHWDDHLESIRLPH